MDGKRFEQIVDERFNACRLILAQKEEEYSVDGDRLSNFKRAGFIELVKPETALLGMLTKHVVSVYDAIDELEFRDKVPSKEWIHAKLTDWINYALLLEGLIEERRERENEEND